MTHPHPLFVAALFATAPLLSAQAPATAAAPAAAAQQPAPQKLDSKRYDHFGAGIVEGKNTLLADVLAAPERFVGKPIRVLGPVTEVCQNKGCWMHLGNSEPVLMVKFKDYGFFVPKDASGRNAILNGTMTIAQETVEQTRHYLEDAGKHEEAKKVTEGRKVYSFVADGVAIDKLPLLDAARYDHFGTGVAADKAVPLADVLAAPEQFAGKPIRVEGPVTAVCQAKGCWMHLGNSDPVVMVKFLDYGFFMPKDASGRTAILEGTMTIGQETVEQTRHYLEDAGKHEEAKKVTEGRKVYSFVATGVALQKRSN